VWVNWAAGILCVGRQKFFISSIMLNMDLSALRAELKPLVDGIKRVQDGQARQTQDISSLSHTQQRQAQDISSMNKGISSLAESVAR